MSSTTLTNLSNSPKPPADAEVMISVRGLGKAYTIAHAGQRATTLAEAAVARLRSPFHRPERETFWALKDVSFDVRRGDVVGVIGRNGAGKSTLFKVLSRITEPTVGTVDLYGRVGSLLEVGTGFSGELTGRENIYLNGSILGMRRAEITRRFDEIVDFAGVEKFLDTPVKRYSSGMYVRLAFAVAAHLDSEILIVDEVLAVGDVAFQKRCVEKIQQITASRQRAVMFVSHNPAIVDKLCNRAILLDSGCLILSGTNAQIRERYFAVQSKNRTLATRSSTEYNPLKPRIRAVRIERPPSDGLQGQPLNTDAPARIVMEVDAKIANLHMWIGICRPDGQRVAELNSTNSSPQDVAAPGDSNFFCHLASLHLLPGTYRIDASITDGHTTFDHMQAACEFEVEATVVGDRAVERLGDSVVVHLPHRFEIPCQAES